MQEHETGSHGKKSQNVLRSGFAIEPSGQYFSNVQRGITGLPSGCGDGTGEHGANSQFGEVRPT
jgi:hypothetical protein